jgi:hypothetical protein
MTNAKKCKIIVFGKSRTELSSFSVGQDVICRSDEVTYLGLRIDSQLDWHVHINYIIFRIRQFRYTLNRLRCSSNPNLRAYLAKVFILPVIDLYDFIYCTASSGNLQRLNVAYNDLMRTIIGASRSEHISIVDLCRRSTLDLLSARSDRALLTFMNKVVSGDACSMLRSQCIPRRNVHGTRSRNIYAIPKFYTNVGSHRILVRCLKMLSHTNNACQIRYYRYIYLLSQ